MFLKRKEEKRAFMRAMSSVDSDIKSRTRKSDEHARQSFWLKRSWYSVQKSMMMNFSARDRLREWLNGNLSQNGMKDLVIWLEECHCYGTPWWREANRASCLRVQHMYETKETKGEVQNKNGFVTISNHVSTTSQTIESGAHLSASLKYMIFLNSWLSFFYLRTEQSWLCRWEIWLWITIKNKLTRRNQKQNKN